MENIDEKKQLSWQERVKNYFSLYKLKTKDIATNAIVAALYVALTYAFYWCSYGMIQFRISEFLILLVFFNPNYIYGLTIGCALANIYSVSMGLTPVDIVFGSLATLISCLLMSPMRHMFFASLIPALMNGLIVGAELTFLMGGNGAFFYVNFGWVFLGEFVVISIFSYALFFALMKKNTAFPKLINAKRNIEFRF